ncbi:MAG: ribonuclease J [Lachnospiraceae bacterium]|nr:ribonuclease J [Lachnospiraceae bacterium]
MSKLRIIPLGGLDQIGMNITAFEYEDDIIIVDCGLAFPSDDMLGIDLVIPDVRYLEDNIDRVRGFFITHGHEDHIGALPYVLRKINVPIYGTKLSMALIDGKLEELGMENMAKRKIVRYGQTVTAGRFRVEFIRINHSIADSAAFAITTPAGTVVHTGDFKVDYTPVFGDPINLARFAELGNQGVLALLCDSTNALKEGFTQSESTVGRTIQQIFDENAESRIIVATFASNVDRVQQIINAAVQHGRKVAVDGRSMIKVLGTASEVGYIDIPDGTLITMEELADYPREKVVLITTGSQGEAMASLPRMAASIHRKVTIDSSDVIILSSTPIPGNEKAVYKVINELESQGAKVIFQDVHVSGHACREEMKLIYSLTKPKYAIPLHGEFRHRTAQAGIAASLGIPRENIFLLEAGDVLELDGEGACVVDKVPSGRILVDGLGVGDVGNIVLRDRQYLAQHGIIILVSVFEHGSGQLIAGPDIITRGFVYVRESEELMEEAHEVAYGTVLRCQNQGVTDWTRIKTEMKEDLSDFLWKRMRRSPMIIPIIMEV